MGQNNVDREQLRTRAAKVRLLALDVDGVLTDGRLHFDASGKECKVFHARDGYGIRRFLDTGLDIAVISGRKSLPVERRTDELGIRHVFLGIGDKPSVLAKLVKSLGHDWSEVAYVGDDVPDLECMRLAGLAIAVADAHTELDAVAHWRTSKTGGHGAVREVCDLILDARAAASS
jgi:3-deoxy-D-manno-octulosonate 8-phosphate phosphatase (KDO 8-P phosphatase)